MIEELLGRIDGAASERSRSAWIGRGALGGRAILLVRPRTYMNRSGAAVRSVLEREGAGPHQVLVVCDDLYLPFETMRLRARGSHGGHNGLLSIIERLGTRDFARLRIGVGPPDSGAGHADHVLGRFPSEESRRLPELVKRAADCAEAVVVEGLQSAMTRYNRRHETGSIEEPR